MEQDAFLHLADQHASAVGYSSKPLNTVSPAGWSSSSASSICRNSRHSKYDIGSRQREQR